MIGENIKKLRTELGLSQEALARKTFMTQHALSQYETGARRIPDDKLELLAEELSVSIHFLKKADARRKPASFYESKTLKEFERMSSEELTEYLMHALDKETLHEIAGNFPYDYFIQLSYDQQYDEVQGAIEQYPWDLFVPFLKDVCIESEDEFQKYVDSLN